jgi:hypothetical protein
LKWYDREGENAITSKKIFEVEVFFSSQNIDFNILVADAYSGMELCTPTWLNHNYGDGGVVDVYFGVEVRTPKFLGEASKKNSGQQIIFEKNSKLKWTHPLTNLNTNKS